MATFISNSPAETEELGERWGRAASCGLVICLSGDLGAGKTQLVHGVARGLDVPVRVHSPTFALVNIYSGGRLTLFHLDLYRLDTIEQIEAAGLDEYLNPNGVTVIEWAEKWIGESRPLAGRSPGSTAAHNNPRATVRGPLLWVTIETISPTERRIDYDDSGI